MSYDNYLSCAETAKLVRAALKKSFPGIKFSVRSSNYAGGASIDVDWTDGPTHYAVDRVIGQFTGGDFDGMIDLKTNHSSWLLPDGSAMIARDSGTVGSMGIHQPIENAKPHPEAKLVHFGADFIFSHRKYTAEFMTPIVNYTARMHGFDAPPVVASQFGAHYANSKLDWNQERILGEALQNTDAKDGQIWDFRQPNPKYNEKAA